MKALRGFTLIETLTTVVVLAIVVAIAYPAYQKFVWRGRLANAHQLMLDNARDLEKFYAKNYGFKQNSTTWAALSHTENEYFCIKMQGNPRGTTRNSVYTMKALAKDASAQPRVLLLNQDGTAQVCESSVSSCSEDKFFRNAGRADRNCRAYP